MEIDTHKRISIRTEETQETMTVSNASLFNLAARIIVCYYTVHVE